MSQGGVAASLFTPWKQSNKAKDVLSAKTGTSCHRMGGLWLLMNQMQRVNLLVLSLYA